MRYLIVANRTLGGDHLIDEIRRRVKQGPCTFHVLVPASRPHGSSTWTEGEARVHAEAQLAAALDRIHALGIPASGEVGDASPVEAVSDVLLREQFDEIILSTFPLGLSRWLRQDAVHRIQRRHGIAVVHVVAEPATVG